MAGFEVPTEGPVFLGPRLACHVPTPIWKQVGSKSYKFSMNPPEGANSPCLNPSIFGGRQNQDFTFNYSKSQLE
jgi:hypothetical protein